MMRRTVDWIAMGLIGALGVVLLAPSEASAQCDPGWELVGEDADNYFCSPVREIPVGISLAQPGVTFKSWGGRVYKFTCVGENDCAWVRVTASTRFRPDDEVRIFPGGFVTVALPNGQTARFDPQADGSREVIVDLGFVYDTEMYRWEEGVSPSSDLSSDPPAAPRPSPRPRLRMNLYLDPESLGLEPDSFTGPKIKVYIPVVAYEDRGPDDRGGVCRWCDSPLIESGEE